MEGPIAKLSNELVQEIVSKSPADVRNSLLTTSKRLKSNVDTVRTHEVMKMQTLKASHDQLMLDAAGGKYSMEDIGKRAKKSWDAVPPNVEAHSLKRAGYNKNDAADLLEDLK